jgi:tRNA (guanine-N7-)-methyltransferase
MSLSFDRRQIRSYVIRAGRMTPGQIKALETQWVKYGIKPTHAPLLMDTLFPRFAPVVLEIGFGMGDSLFEMAQANPDLNFIGVEVHRPGVGHLLHRAAEAELTNLRVMSEDSVGILANCISEGTLATIQIFFPDPWHKKKHHKRRLISSEFLTLVFSRLAPGGILHVATDWAPYAEAIDEVVSNNQGFIATPPPARPVTKYERRGLRLGHEVFDRAWSRTALTPKVFSAVD